MNQHLRLFTGATSPEKSRRLECPDMIALVGFHHGAVVLSKFVSTHDHAFEEAVARLPQVINNYTNLAAGLRESINLVSKAPRGMRRRIWALSDGQDNVETDKLFGEVRRAAENRININTIGFGLGNGVSPGRLKAVSAGTHNGRYITVESAKRLGKSLRSGLTGPAQVHQGEATVYCIDLSPSMNDKMGSKSKIEVVRDTMLDLIHYKRLMWS